MDSFSLTRSDTCSNTHFRSPTLLGLPLSHYIENITISKRTNWIPPWTRIHALSKKIPGVVIKFETSINNKTSRGDGSPQDHEIDEQSLLSCLPRTLPPSIFSCIKELELPYVHFKNPKTVTRFVRSFPDIEKCTYATLEASSTTDSVEASPSRVISTRRHFTLNKFLAASCSFETQLKISLAISSAQERLRIRNHVWNVALVALITLFPDQYHVDRVVVSKYGHCKSTNFILPPINLICALSPTAACIVTVKKHGRIYTIEFETSGTMKTHTGPRSGAVYDIFTLRISCMATGSTEPPSNDLRFDAFIAELNDSDVIPTVIVSSGVLPRKCCQLLLSAQNQSTTCNSLALPELLLNRETISSHLLQSHKWTQISPQPLVNKTSYCYRIPEDDPIAYSKIIAELVALNKAIFLQSHLSSYATKQSNDDQLIRKSYESYSSSIATCDAYYEASLLVPLVDSHLPSCATKQTKKDRTSRKHHGRPPNHLPWHQSRISAPFRARTINQPVKGMRL